MADACHKLYGNAASHMLQYYQTIEKAMAADNLYSSRWDLPSPEEVYTPQVQAEAISHLNLATGMVSDPTILARINTERKIWERAKQVIGNLRVQSAND